MGKGLSPYFLESSVYVIQENRVGTSRRFPIRGNRRGPGGYRSLLRLLLSRIDISIRNIDIKAKRSLIIIRETMVVVRAAKLCIR